MHEGVIMAHKYRVVRGNASPEDAISAASYPASGSFIDVSGVSFVHIWVELGAIAASDAPVFTVQATSAANGTLATVDSSNLVHTAADDDDDELVYFGFPTAILPTDSHFITLTASGTLVGTQASITFWLEDHEKPVTQGALPAASIHYTA